MGPFSVFNAVGTVSVVGPNIAVGPFNDSDINPVGVSAVGPVTSA